MGRSAASVSSAQEREGELAADELAPPGRSARVPSRRLLPARALPSRLPLSFSRRRIVSSASASWTRSLSGICLANASASARSVCGSRW